MTPTRHDHAQEAVRRAVKCGGAVYASADALKTRADIACSARVARGVSSSLHQYHITETFVAAILSFFIFSLQTSKTSFAKLQIELLPAFRSPLPENQN